MPASAPTRPRQSAGFKDRNDYLKYLEEQRARKGEEWYNQKLKEANAREELRSEKRKLADRDWRMEIRTWGNNPQAIQQVADGLDLGSFTEPTRTNRRYRDVRGNALLINFDGRFWFMDRAGLKSLRGKSSGRGVLSLVTAIKELDGEMSPYSAAKKYLIAVSGIQPRDFTMSEDEMAKIRQKIADQAKLIPAPAPRVETEIDEAKVPKPITDPATVLNLRKLVAEERGFPEEYVQRMESEGVIYYGASIYHGRPLVASRVTGFETGKTVAISTRKIPKLSRPTDKKGLCEGQVAMGATIIGPWDNTTKRVLVTEGVYDAGALRLLREKDGTADPKDCYMILSGTRVPDELVRICGERKIPMVAALDNDIAGRNMEAHLREAAEKYGTQVTGIPIARGEVDVEFRDSTVGRDFYEKTIGMARELGIPFGFKQPKDDYLRLVMPTTDASCKVLEQIRNEFYRGLKAALPKKTSQQERDSEEDKDFILSWHRKDWNELVKEPNYKRQVKTTAGLPQKNPALHEEALKRLTEGYGIEPAIAGRLLAANVAYPIQSCSGPKLIWPLVGSKETPVGAMFEPITADCPRRAVGQPGASICLAAKSPITQEHVIADTLERGIEAWIKSDYTAMVHVVPDRHLSPALRESMAQANLPVRVLAEESEKSVRFQAEIEAEAKLRGITVQAVLDRSPKTVLSVDARPDKQDPEKQKRAEAVAKRLHDLAVKNKHEVEVIRTKDGYIQIRSDNHNELINEATLLDKDSSGSIEPEEVQRRASDGSKSARVVIEYHGRGISRSEAAQSFRGSDTIETANATKPSERVEQVKPEIEIADTKVPPTKTTAQIAEAKKPEIKKGLDIDDD